MWRRGVHTVVIGGGHAGVEAAAASARTGASTVLLTTSAATIGEMSCNPSIGGIGKGHLVKEVDALGGAMALATDEAGIQFRILNSSKGPAVRATRAQADRILYKAAIRRMLENQPNLWLFQQAVDDLMVEGDRVVGAVTQVGIRFRSRAVVLTAGTFLDGKIHVGLQNYSGGRAGDPPAISLGQRLKELKLPQGRLKTGTPPRIDGRSINYGILEEQPGDLDPIPVFSYLGNVAMHPRQLPCWITHTNARTHDIIRGGLDRSPMYSGVIEGVGPRYCPSIEDKIHRFADKQSHQVFLEPEGLDTHEVYPNGVSTSLPFDVQLELIHSLPGLENAHILRPGYAIEYDYFDPRGLKSTLETKAIDGQESAYLVTKSSGYQEIQKYMTETNHVFLPAVVMASKRFWDRLSKDERAVIQQSCDESVTYFRQVSRDQEKKVVGELSAAGMSMNKIDPAEKQRMVQATAAVTEKYKTELGAELVDRTVATINQTRK